MAKGNRASKVTPITPQQFAVGKLLAMGFTAKEVGLQLGIETKTVEVHRSAVFAKAKVDNVVRFTHFAIRTGMIEVL